MKKQVLLFISLLMLVCSSFGYRDLETGVFLTRDPIGYGDGPNVYCYVYCNPITKFDVFGLTGVYIGGAAEGRSNSFMRPDGSLTTQVIGYGEVIGADASFEWSDTDAAVGYIKNALKDNPYDNITITGHSWGGPASFRIADKLNDEGVSIDSLSIITLDPVSHFSKNALGTKPPENVAEWVNIYQPATLADGIMNIPVVGWALGALWTGASSLSQSANGVATGGGQWNSENNASQNVPAVDPVTGKPLGHMDVNGMTNLPVSDEQNAPTAKEYIKQRNEQGELKQKLEEDRGEVDATVTA